MHENITASVFRGTKKLFYVADYDTMSVADVLMLFIFHKRTKIVS